MMARTLPRIAPNALIITATGLVLLMPLRAWAEGDVRIAPASEVVENPFASRAVKPLAPAAPRSIESGPQTYQNPFAERSAAEQAPPPRYLALPSRSGSLSRWRRPVELPGDRLPQASSAGSVEPAAVEWDLLSPSDLRIDQGRDDQVEMVEDSPANVQGTASSPPDPIRFGPRDLRQPAWLAPGSPETGSPLQLSPLPGVDEAQPLAGRDDSTELLPGLRAAEALAPQQPPQVNVPPPPVRRQPADRESDPDPFERTEIAVVVSDQAPKAAVDPPMARTAPYEPPASPTIEIRSPAAVALPPVDARDARDCYRRASQAAAEAESLPELAVVVQLCQQGLSSGPRGELAAALRSLAAWACNRRGEIESDSQREDNALREFETAIQWDPNCWLALHNRAVSRAQQGQAELALRDFNRAIDLNPGLAIAYRNRGELLSAMGHMEEAVADYSRAIEQLPQDTDLHQMRGHALHRLGRYQQALDDLTRAIQLAPNNAEAYTHRGNVYAERNEFAEALRDFESALRIDEESADAYRSVAWLLATCPDARYRDPQKALVAAQGAAHYSPPGDPFVLEALAAVYADAGQFEPAVRYQREAVALAPPGFEQQFATRLAIYQHGRPFRNGTGADGAGDVRAASLEAPPPRRGR